MEKISEKIQHPNSSPDENIPAPSSLKPKIMGVVVLQKKNMGVVLLPDLGTEILIPVCVVVGIVFPLIQWYIVSRVKLSPDSVLANNNKNGYSEILIEEEEGLNDPGVIAQCTEIQNAISEGR